MPSFLNPAFLFGLVLGVIPLLIHLLHRQKLKKMSFSSLWFLKALQKTKIQRIRIREILLLILRSLIILLLVAAFARPVIKEKNSLPFGSKARSAAVIILDDSYSMALESKGSSIFEKAARRAAEILNIFTASDQVALILASQPEQFFPFTSDLAAFEKDLLKLPVSYGTSDFQKSLVTALELLKNSKNLNQEIYLISDFCQNGWDFNIEGFSSNIRIYLIDVGEGNLSNLSLTDFNFERKLLTLKQTFGVTAEVKNFGTQAQKEVLLGIYQDGARQSQTDIELKKQENKKTSFNLKTEKSGWHQGWVEIASDVLLPDNYYYFTYHIPEKIKVLLVGKSAADNLYLNLALAPQSGINPYLQVESFTAGEIPQIKFADYDVVILSNSNFFSAYLISQLENFIKSGKGIFIFMSPRENPGLDFVEKLFNLKLARVLESENQESFFILEKFDITHPIFEIYSKTSQERIPRIKLFKIWETEGFSPASVLAWFSNQAPAFLEKKSGQSKILLFLGELSSSEITTHPFFVFWLNRSVSYLVSDIARQNEKYLVNAKIQRILPSVSVQENLILIAPDSSQTKLKPYLAGENTQLDIINSSQPGIYKILSGNKLLDMFAVNVDTKESNLNRVDKKIVEKRLASFKLYQIDSERELASQILAKRQGRELWKEFLWAAIVLLSIEMIISRTKGFSKEEMESSSLTKGF